MPMSDLNFDKYPSCLSWQVLNRNRGRMADRTYSILYWPFAYTIKPCLFFSILFCIIFPHNYYMVKEEKGE